MAVSEVNIGSHLMTQESMSAFIEHHASKGASENTIRRLKAAMKMLYDFLPADKELTKGRLIEWRADLNAKGYATQTVQNYAKCINLYLDFAGLSKIRFNKGRARDIAGMEFGFITAIEPTDKRDRKDIVWRCRCRCGTELELPATRLVLNNTLSCGCIKREVIKRANKYFDGTSLEQSLKESVESTRSGSGYVGVTRKSDKWLAYINYKREHIPLGTYSKLEDAVKARARGKEAVMEDAAELLKIYEELHENDEALPSKLTEPRKDFSCAPKEIGEGSVVNARRSDNTSGYTGISFRKNRWEARICYRKIRYMLGRFDTQEKALSARECAEKMLKNDPEAFVEYYSKNCRQYAI